MKSNVNEENFNELMNTIFVEYGVNRFYFEHYNENLSDDELSAKFEEVFGKCGDDDKKEKCEEDPDSKSDEDTNEPSEDSTDGEPSNEDVEPDNPNDKDDDTLKEDNACGGGSGSKKKKNNSQNETITRTYELSHDDIRCALYNLLALYEEADDEYYYHRGHHKYNCHKDYGHEERRSESVHHFFQFMDVIVRRVLVCVFFVHRILVLCGCTRSVGKCNYTIDCIIVNSCIYLGAVFINRNVRSCSRRVPVALRRSVSHWHCQQSGD